MTPRALEHQDVAARAEVVVDLAAVRHNVRLLRELAGVALMVVVKADGYGHGMVEVARAAREAGAEWLATATPEEAVALREAGDTGPLLCWLWAPGDDLAPAIAQGVEVTAYSVAELDAIAGTVAALPVLAAVARVQIKVDTGLSRGGAPPAQWDAVLARARRGEQEGTWQVTGLWSHLACADEPDHPANDAQQARFEQALAAAAAAGLEPGLRHLANSAATLLRPRARYDLVRCGIAAYGLDPAPGTGHGAPLVPAMTVRARLALVKDLDPGDGVSYGHAWTAQQRTAVGLVPVGYADGVPRHAGGAEATAEVVVRGRRRPVRGRICMDQFMVGLDPAEDVAAGEEAVLLGPPGEGRPTAQDWAEACGTISYEIVTRMGGRMSRRYVDSGLDQPARPDDPSSAPEVVR